MLAGVVVITAWWASELLGRTPDWNPWLQPLVLLGGAAVAFTIAFGPVFQRRAAVVLGLGALAVCLAAPAAYSLSTVTAAKGGAIPLAGPASVLGFGPGGGGAPGGGQAGGFGPPGGTAAGGRAGGLLNGSDPGAEVTALLERGSDGYRWAAAAIGANTAAGYQLASGEPIMAIGGFNGTDPSPTLTEFQAYVASGDVHYFIASGSGPGGGGFGGPGGGSSTSNEIRSWVETNFDSVTVDGITIYDLTTASV